jgi:WD40 repeat protein
VGILATLEPATDPRYYFIGAATTTYKIQGLDNLPELAAEVERVAVLFDQLQYERVAGFGVDIPGEELRRRLRHFFTDPQRRSTDVVVFYYTGHGHLIDSELALPTTDTTEPTLSTVWANGLAVLLSGTSVERILFIIDTCYSSVGGSALTHGAIAFVNRLGGPVSPAIGVLVSARPREQASPGAFPKALVHAVCHPASGGHEPQFLPLDGLVQIINANTPGWQHSRLFFVGDGTSIFFPNMRYDTALRDFDLRTQVILRQRQARAAEQDEHVLPHAQGQEASGSEDLWIFTGRHQALEDVRRWLMGEDDATTMVVTGDPGSGKSSLLSRVFVLADERLHAHVPGLHTLPAETLPPIGSVSRFIHARGLAPQAVLEALAEACGAPEATTSGELIMALGRRTEPLVVIVDALDETTGDATLGARRPFPVVDEVLGPLVRTAGITGLRLLLGTRRNLLAPLGATDGSGTIRLVDLDSDRYADPASIRSYAASCLIHLHVESPYRFQEHHYVDAVAAAIAESAQKSFLVALITARGLALRNELVNPRDPGWRDALPREASAAMRDDLVGRLGTDADKARDLLLPLAYGQGAGLPWEDLWPRLASALAGARYTSRDIDWLVDQAGYYVVESTSDHRSTYRLYHEALSDHVRSGRDQKQDHATIVRALVGHVPRLPDGQPDWAKAHPYIRSQLVNHAVAAGVIDDLVADPRYLLAATPATLLAALPTLASRDGRAAADAYRRALARIRDSPPAQHAAYLQLAARCARAPQLADATTRQGLELTWSTDWASWRLQPPHQTLAGHEGPVTAVAVGEVDGRIVAVSAGHDMLVRVWSLPAGTLSYPPLAGHTHWVNSVAVGHIGTQAVIVAGGNDGTVRRWDGSTGAAIGRPYRHTDAVTAVAVGQAAGRTVVVSASVDRTIRVWDAESGVDIGQPYHSRDSWASAVAVGPVGGTTVVVAGGVDGRVRVWNPLNGQQRSTETGHDGPVNAVAFGLVDGRMIIASGGVDRTIARWDATTMHPIGPPLTGNSGLVNAVAFGTLNGKPVLVSGSSDTTVRVWDATTGSPSGEPYNGHAFDVRAVAFGEVDGRAVVVSAGNDATVRIWDASNSPLVGDPFVGHHGRVNAVALGHSRGRGILVTAGSDATARVWDAATGAAIGEPYTEHVKAVTAVAVTELDGRVVAITGSADHSLRIWDVHTRQLLGEPLVGHTKRVTAVATGRLDGREVAVSGSDDMTVRLWDLASTSAIKPPMRGHTDWVNAVAIGTVAGRTIVVSGGSDRTVRMWDARTGEPSGRVISHLEGVRALAMADVGGRAVVVSGGVDRTVRVSDASNDADLGTQIARHTGEVNALAVGEVDGEPVVVSGGNDATVLVRDLATGRPVADPLIGLTGRVTTLAVGDLNGKTIVASGSSDATVRVWEVGTHTLIGDPHIGHTGRVTSVAVGTFDGRGLVVTGGDDRTVRIWDADRGSLLRDPLIGHPYEVRSVAIGRLADRTIVASCGPDRSVRISDALTGELLGSALTGHTDWVNAVVLGVLDGRTVAASASDDRTVRLWDVATHIAQAGHVIEHSGAVKTVAIGHIDNEMVIISGGTDQAVRVWYACTGTPVCGPLTGHQDTVTTVAFAGTDRGPVIVSASADRTIRLWDARTGNAIGEPLVGHRAAVTSVGLMHAHGQPTIASVSADHTLRIWTPAAEFIRDTSSLDWQGWSATVIDFATPLHGVALPRSSAIVVVGDLGVCSLRLPHR